MKNLVIKLLVVLGFSLNVLSAQNYQARGVGSIGQHYNLHPTQKMLMARESAIIDAQRRLMEFVVGAKMKTNSVRKNTALLSEEVTSQSEGLVRGAIIISERQIGTQAYEVVMAIKDDSYDKRVDLEEIIDKNKSHQKMEERVTPITQDYINDSLDISPNAMQVQNIQVRVEQTESVEDDVPPAWLFDKKDIEEMKKSNSLRQKLKELERINKLKSQMIESLKK
ncbi:MAG: hypothetical protein COB02_04775 [Candidatus Cloacimonadota bacterium]|nr:MAG: hypothetical protein COB02_04775 [Candidatus Cloacimonadota bacterium]